jgi:radical SAM superfamily enzyme YgiQ (UPF0313 family)
MISTQLVKEDCETKIIDSGPEKKDIHGVLQEARSFNPAITIISSATPTIATDLGWFADQLKESVPHTLIAAVGIHVSVLPEDVLTRFNSVDFLIMGEPEISAKELVLTITDGAPVEYVEGIARRDKEGKIRLNRQREFIGDLDSLGFPDWQKISFSNYLLPIKKRKFSLISFSRGCPFSCTYCATHTYNGRILRKRSIGSLMKEIDYNRSMGVKDFLFWTELMTGDKVYLNDFLDSILKEGLGKEISWVCNSRVDGIDYELASKMKEAGCWQIAFGFEFGDDAILNRAKKGGKVTVSQSEKAANAANRAGIVVDGHFIMGYPGENVQTMQKTIDLACSLPLTFAHFYAAVPFPGSELYEEAIKNCWIRNDNLHGQDSACIHTDILDTATVDRYIKKAYRAFYFRPGTTLRVLKIPRSLRELAEIVRMGLRFYNLLKKP